MQITKRVVIVLPAFNASSTLERTFAEIPKEIISEIVLVDDASKDNTVKIASKLGIRHVIEHSENKGYGANQKTCYQKALSLGADIIVMLHPDYQYTPKLIPSMVSIISNELYPVVLGSRILGNGALKGGMPLYKYWANRLLTFFQNICTQAKLSEYHTGFRAFDARVFSNISLEHNSDDFVFDNQMLSQIIMAGYPIAEITCPTKYFEESSSINFRRSIIYGIGVVGVSIQHWLHKNGILKHKRYEKAH